MRKNALLILIAILCFGCGKDEVVFPLTLEKPALIFPSQNSACTPSVVLSAIQSSVTLTWDPVKDADSYDITVKNLISGESVTQNTAAPTIMLTLARSNAYSWFVVAKSAKITEVTTSDTWKFYNPGPGAVYYAPFPADASAPLVGQSVTAVAGKINLSWQGSDADNDITSYDVYLGTTANTITLVKANVTDAFLNANTLVSGTTYYWKVVTKDAKGNTSDSGVFNFKVN
jgi:hypothetical protein